MTILMQFRSLTFVFHEDNKACLNTIVIIRDRPIYRFTDIFPDI